MKGKIVIADASPFGTRPEAIKLAPLIKELESLWRTYALP